MNNKIIRMTPIGKAKFVYISEPDTQFDSRGIYHCSTQNSKQRPTKHPDTRNSQ